MSEKNQNELLARVDKNRRDFLKRVLGTSFVAPVIASFSVATVLPSAASAQSMANTFSNTEINDPLFLELFWRGDDR